MALYGATQKIFTQSLTLSKGVILTSQIPHIHCEEKEVCSSKTEAAKGDDIQIMIGVDT